MQDAIEKIEKLAKYLQVQSNEQENLTRWKKLNKVSKTFDLITENWIDIQPKNVDRKCPKCLWLSKPSEC